MRIIANIGTVAGNIEEQELVKNPWTEQVNRIYNENKEENLNERIRKYIADKPSAKDKEKC